MANKVKIIGGQWRSRVLSFPDAPGLRPTPARVRETLFNWLQFDVAGKRCLDLFAGSGALGFEAASRGAAHVTVVDNNPLVQKTLIENQRQLSAANVVIAPQEAFEFLFSQAEAFDLVFLDPPFADQLLSQTCSLLENRGWLSTAAKIYIESDRHKPLTDLPTNWQCLKHKQAGEVSYQLFSRIS